jgi:hypothetical protein
MAVAGGRVPVESGCPTQGPLVLTEMEDALTMGHQSVRITHGVKNTTYFLVPKMIYDTEYSVCVRIHIYAGLQTGEEKSSGLFSFGLETCVREIAMLI